MVRGREELTWDCTSRILAEIRMANRWLRFRFWSPREFNPLLAGGRRRPAGTRITAANIDELQELV